MENFQSKVEKQFAQWIALNFQDKPTEEQIHVYFSQLEILGIVKSPQIFTDFCKTLTRITVASSQLPPNTEQLNYTYIDSFVKLILVILKTFEFNKVLF